MTSIDVEVDLKNVTNKFEEPNWRRGRYALGNQMIADMDSFVPRLEGDLRTAVALSHDSKEIDYNMQYASKQYHNHFSNYTTPGTGPYWDKKAAAFHGSAWAKVFLKGAGF